MFVNQMPQQPHSAALVAPQMHNQINLINDINYMVFPNSPINSPMMPAANEIAS
jgi:hypothetical protein